MAIDFNKLERCICQIEQNYFTIGAFNENIVRNDLQYRPANELSQKKNFYIQDFNGVLETINIILNAAQNHQPLDSMLISRCEKCKNQMNKLLGIVRSF